MVWHHQSGPMQHSLAFFAFSHSPRRYLSAPAKTNRTAPNFSTGLSLAAADEFDCSIIAVDTVPATAGVNVIRSVVDVNIELLDSSVDGVLMCGVGVDVVVDTVVAVVVVVVGTAVVVGEVFIVEVVGTLTIAVPKGEKWRWCAMARGTRSWEKESVSQRQEGE